MITAPLTALKRHPGQMRTTYDLEKMATLTLQIYERNLDEWQPIVATPNGEGYHIISGHRRHMACLFAFALDDWREKQKSVTARLPWQRITTVGIKAMMMSR